jgi:hypothetical protein
MYFGQCIDDIFEGIMSFETTLKESFKGYYKSHEMSGIGRFNFTNGGIYIG